MTAFRGFLLFLTVMVLLLLAHLLTVDASGDVWRDTYVPIVVNGPTPTLWLSSISVTATPTTVVAAPN